MGATATTGSELDQRLTYAVGLAFRAGYELPGTDLLLRAEKLLDALAVWRPSSVSNIGVAIDPNGYVEIIVPLAKHVVTIWLDDQPHAEVVLDERGEDGAVTEEHFQDSEVVAWLSRVG